MASACYRQEHPKHTLVVYAGLTFFTIVVMAPYKWDKKWMRIKTSIGMFVFGVSLRFICSAGLCIDEMSAFLIEFSLF